MGVLINVLVILCIFFFCSFVILFLCVIIFVLFILAE
jgi:hypothetical protein